MNGVGTSEALNEIDEHNSCSIRLDVGRTQKENGGVDGFLQCVKAITGESERSRRYLVKVFDNDRNYFIWEIFQGYTVLEKVSVLKTQLT